MSIVRPFRAVRPAPDKAEKVACVPYDVVYKSEVREYIENNPLSFLRVTRSEAEFPKGSKPELNVIFERAKANLQRFLADGTLFSDPDEAFYVYQLSTKVHSQIGIVACCSLDDYDRGLIKKHEKVRQDKVEDRTEHLLATEAQTGLIFLAFRGTEKTGQLIDDTISETPLYDFECPAGVHQRVWKVVDTARVIDAFGEVPALYIADGHHRAESAKRAREELKRRNPDHNGEEDYNFVLAGIFPAEDLKILPYNRVVKDLNGLSEDQFLEKVARNFVISETSEKQPAKHGEICMYMNGKWRKLTFNIESDRQLDPVDALDVSILQNFVLTPILGLTDARTDKRISFVGGARGTAELERLVDKGKAVVAFSMYPTTIEDLFLVSDMGEIMPPKSTWFEPKLKDGLLIHLI